MKDTGQKISEALRLSGLDALRLYEEAPSVELNRIFGETMSLLAFARAVDLDRLPQLFAFSRREDRSRICSATIERILELANDEPALHRIGERFPMLVLEGTWQQQFCCRLAADFGWTKDVPDFVRTAVMKPLIGALRVVLRVGAPASRHAAIEGLGALLKHFDDLPAEFPPDTASEVMRDLKESDWTHDNRRRISEQFFARLQRQRLMVLAIAGNDEARNAFSDILAEPIANVLAQARTGSHSADHVADVLWKHSDLLRVVPAVVRQGGGSRLPLKPGDLLIRAEQLPTIEYGAQPEVVIAFAGYRESVFRTIDTALRRGWKWKKFDDVVAAAVRALPRTVVGSPAMCNAEVRATVATLRTAIRLLQCTGDDASSTGSALVPLFENLQDEPTEWANHGIAEGCFQGLPDLLGNPLYRDLVRPAVVALFAQMKYVPPRTDLLKTHRRLIVNGCFRGILRSLTEELRERQLFEPELALRGDREQVDYEISLLLRDPTPENLRKVFRHDMAPAETAHLEIAEPIIAGIALQNEVLRRSSTFFSRWPELSTAEKVLLVRILAVQLHAIARGLPELRRHALLRRVFTQTPGVSFDDDETLRLAWELISSLPAEAAAAANIEIERFAEERGEKDLAAHGRGDLEIGLPGYVLAMVSPVASGRVAAAIAREVDLHLRRERAVSPADCARSLYQIMLRGPHEAIFDHLLPRLHDAEERSMAMLFRRSVADARNWTAGHRLDVALIHEQVRMLAMDLKPNRSMFLDDLREALILYCELTARTDEVWKRIAQGDVVRFFRRLDDLAQQADASGLRIALMPHYGRELSQIKDEVAHYVALPVGHFIARTAALTRASDISVHLENVISREAGLHGPEQVLLLALMQHLRELFDMTVRWYCNEPRRRMDDRADDENARFEFWLLFCDAHPGAARLESLAALVRSGPGDVDILDRLAADQQFTALLHRLGEAPPPYPGQRVRFEQLFVDWLNSIGDMDTLEKVLHPRWPGWFRALRSMLVSTGVAVSIFIICGWAAAMDATDRHWLEGAGFFIVLTIVVAAVLFVATNGLRDLVASFTRRRRDADPRSRYWFAAVLPATPIVLSVGFDHTWDLPLHGSTWVLLFVMLMSYLGSRLVMGREIAARNGAEIVLPAAERKRVSRRINLSLAYSFAAAVLLSAIFASSYEHADHADHKQPQYAAVGPWPKILDIPAAVLHRFDEIPAEHQHPRFLGVLPREVVLDFSQFLTLPPEVAGHAQFVFYPTVILTWTALGLFFGVFLEGVLKRARGRFSEAGAD